MQYIADISFFDTLCPTDKPIGTAVLSYDGSRLEIALHDLTNRLNNRFPNLKDMTPDELAGDMVYNLSRLDAAALLSDTVAALLSENTFTKTELRNALNSNGAEVQKTTGCDVGEIMSGEYCNRRNHVLV